MRLFKTGATRDTEEGKLDYEGATSAIVLKRCAEYSRKHRKTASGERPCDNWKKGMPRDAYLKSLCRHVMDVRLHHRGFSEEAVGELEDALCAVIFNASGYLHELLKGESK